MSQKRWTIAFAPAGDGKYQVTVRRSGAVHRFETSLPPDISDLWNETGETAGTRSFRTAAAPEAPEARFFQAANLPTLKDIGERVLDCLFDVESGAEGSKIVGALEDRIADSEGVALEIDLSQTAELSGIPWESLYLRSRDRFLAIGTTSNILRRLDAQSELPPPIERPIRILVAAANPKDDLDTDVELGNIQRRIEKLVAEGSSDFEVEALPAVTRDEFRRKVNEWKPHIVHYIGHSGFSDGEGYLYFESGTDGESDHVTAEALRNMLLNRRPWLVVLNSCQSGQTSREMPMAGVAQNLLQRINVPFVVAMQQPVSDDAAINFSQDFYTALTSGETIASAVTLGRCAIANDEDERTQVELITPALYTSGDTDRILFAETETVAAGAAPAAATVATQEAEKSSGSWLEAIDNKTKVVASIIGSVTTIGAAGLAIVHFMSGEPDPVQPTQPTTAATTSGNTVSPVQPDEASGPEELLADGSDTNAGEVVRDRPTSPPPRQQGSSNAGGQVVLASANTMTQTRQARRTFVTRAREIPTPQVRGVSVERLVNEQTGEVTLRWTLEDGSIAYTAEGDPAPYSNAAQDPPSLPPAPPPPPPGSGTYAYGQASGYSGGGGYGSQGVVVYNEVAFAEPGALAPPTSAGASNSGLPVPYLIETLPPATRMSSAYPTLAYARLPAICEGRAATVNFDLGSSILAEEDAARLGATAQWLACPKSQVVVAGFTDTSGPLELNIDLSMARAREVANTLRDRQADEALQTTIVAYAEQAPVVATPDDVPERANRRAEVYVETDCSTLSDVEVSLGPGEELAGRLPTRPYPRIIGEDTPVRIVLHSRELADTEGSFDPRLSGIAQEIQQSWNVPADEIYPMIIGDRCLADTEESRIDIDF